VRRWFALCVAAFVACAVILPAAAADFQVPPTPNHYVTDNAGALSSGARAALEGELQAYERSTGHQVIVWIGQTTGNVPLEQWTVEAAHQWKIGRRGHDDGAVLFLFMHDHQVRIEVGYGLEGSLTDADSHRIIDNDIVPKMKSGNVDGAVSGGVAAMLTTITPSYAGVTPPPETTGSVAGPGVSIMFIIIMVLVIGFVILIIVANIVGNIRHGILLMREGPVKAKAAMKGWWFYGGSGSSGGGSSGGSDSSSDDSDFSSGGGDFGGGGASGSW
jgi:uncharacterized protein